MAGNIVSGESAVLAVSISASAWSLDSESWALADLSSLAWLWGSKVWWWDVDNAALSLWSIAFTLVALDVSFAIWAVSAVSIRANAWVLDGVSLASALLVLLAWLWISEAWWWNVDGAFVQGEASLSKASDG